MALKDSRRFITFERIIKNGFINFGRNIWLAIAAIAMMSITLTILLFAVVANATFSHTVSGITSHIDVSVFLKDSTPDTDKNKLISQLQGLSNVKSVGYVTKAQALKVYEAQNANNSQLSAAIAATDNPLPASVVVAPKDPNNLQQISDYLNKSKYKQDFYYVSYSGSQKTAIDNITHATHFFEEAGVVGIAVFILVSMLIIFNTIRMTIFNRRDELIIMRLLGASPRYIRGPFVVETMLYGAAAALISLGICGGLFHIAASTLQASSLGLLDIGYSSSYFDHHLLVILTGQIAIGIIIGAVSSTLAARRYLRLNH